MEWFSGLFSVEKTIDSLTNPDKGLLVQAGTAISNLYYSDQEKADDGAKTREWGLRMLESTTPFKIIQRILAVSSMFMWIFLGINVVVAIWVEAVYPGVNAKDALLQFALSDYVFWPAMSIFTLYTGGGLLGSLGGKK